MNAYRLEGRLELLPDNLWEGSDPTVQLPDLPEVRPAGDVLIWAVDHDGRRRPLAWQGGLALDFHETLRTIRDGRSVQSPRPLMTYCPFHPHRLPSVVRNAVRHILALGCRRSAHTNTYPQWPVEPTLAVWNALGILTGAGSCDVPWPNGKRVAVALSHDVDTAEGQKAALALAESEERLGLASAWFLCPGNYRVDQGLWREMADRGHEIACHGLLHDFKLPYLSPAAIGDRLDEALEMLSPLEISGFRSPALLRTPQLLDAVAERFSYDSSIPDTVRLHGANGSGSIWPYQTQGLTEVPVTVPYDGELMALGLSLDDRLTVWRRKTDWIRRQGGLVHFLTHPDPQFSGRLPEQQLYRRMLQEIVDEGHDAWFALPREVAEHARRRDTLCDTVTAPPPIGCDVSVANCLQTLES